MFYVGLRDTRVTGGWYDPTPLTSNHLVGGSSTTVNLPQTQGQGLNLSRAITAFGVRLQLKKTGAPTDSILVELLDTAVDTGNVLASGTFSGVSGLTTSYKTIQIPFTASIALAASTNYYIRITRSPDTEDTGNHVFIAGAALGGVFTQGIHYYKYNNVWNTDGGDDLSFALLVQRNLYGPRNDLRPYAFGPGLAR